MSKYDNWQYNQDLWAYEYVEDDEVLFSMSQELLKHFMEVNKCSKYTVFSYIEDQHIKKDCPALSIKEYIEQNPGDNRPKIQKLREIVINAIFL